MFTVTSTDEYDQWFEAQEEAAGREVLAVVRLLAEFGPRLGRPHADTLKGSRFHHMKELRVKMASAEIRIAFAFDPQRDAVLLVAGDKRGVNERRFYRQLIAQADKLYAEHLETHHG